MAVAGCINAYDCSGNLIRTLEQLQSSNIGVGVQYTAPNPLDDKKINYIKYTDKCGCTCTLSGENEILIYSTNGVIKNLSLTNDDTNEKVIVKWNDIFGSNWLKTVVRYKTDSAPTSITDGTLAVEETTKNQYATNGYGVSGLSDDTTYYFSVFGVDTDGTVINVQSSSITTNFFLSKYQAVEYIQSSGTQRIDTGFTATQNTISQVKLMPLEEQGGVLFGTHKGDDTADYRLFNASGYYYLDFPGGTSPGTRITTKDGTNEKWNINSLQEIEIGNFYIKHIGGNTIVSGATQGSFTVNGTLTLNANQSSTAVYAKTRCYYIKIWSSAGNQVRDMRPCYRKSDDVIGMVDKINKVFYTNKGSGTFSKGGNISR